MRKTIHLADLIETVNRRNAKSTCGPEIREGWNSLLESALKDADVYSGYGYLDEASVPMGHRPGVVRDHEGKATSFPDETRRKYFTNRKLWRRT